MSVHHDKAVRKAARTLASNSSTKKEKQEASKILNKHKKEAH